jgi:alkaline phosphatase
VWVAGGRTAPGHHPSSAFRARHDTLAFSDAVAHALENVDLRETLVVVTADHSHVFSIAGYPTRGNPILGLAAGNDRTGEPTGEPLTDLQGLPYTTVGYANGPGYSGASDAQPAGAKHFPHQPTRSEPGSAARPDLRGVDTADPRYLQESAVPLPSETHGGEDVAIYAGGAGSALFHGVQEQSYVYHGIVGALRWDDDAPPAGSDERSLWERLLGR